MGPLIPLFWTSGDVFPGFQSQGGSLACVLVTYSAIHKAVNPRTCMFRGVPALGPYPPFMAMGISIIFITYSADFPNLPADGKS